VRYYVRAGELPTKRHIQFRRPDGGLYAEELFSTRGFEGAYSLLYHLRPPTALLDVRPWERPHIAFYPNDPLRNRHLTTMDLEGRSHLEPIGRDAIDGRVPLFGNDDIVLSAADVGEPMEYFYRNAIGDELLFVHRGRGTLETIFGDLPYRERDYLLVPCNTTYRLRPETPTRLLVHESRGHFRIPAKFLNDASQLAEGAPYYERDFRAPLPRAAIDRSGAFEIRVKARASSVIAVAEHHPFDVVGWDGYCYPTAFNADDYAPITGQLHQPPPAHATFEAPGAALCVFVPRLFDYHPQAIAVPYNHSSVDCDEVLYYVSGNFMSRRGILEGSLTLHAAGMPHGPQPGAVEASLGKSATDELAIMIDTFAPLRLAEPARALEDPTYFRSWRLNPELSR
jgi:homogentisate 1,2-dioxygenase